MANWDGFLDAYAKVRQERDDALDLIRRAVGGKEKSEEIEKKLKTLEERVKEPQKST